MLTLFHDYTSPACAVAVARLQRLADDGLAVEFVGFETVGLDAPLPPTLDVLAEIDLVADEAKAEGVELRRPAAMPPTARAHAVGTLADAHDLGAPWRRLCYRAFWSAGADINDVATLVDLAEAAGLPPEKVATAVTDGAFVASVRRAAARHRRAGVGGVPTILAQRTLIPGLLSEAELRDLGAYP